MGDKLKSVVPLKEVLKVNGRKSKRFREVNGSAVYFLMEGETVLYIGKSLEGRLATRMRRHFCDEDKIKRVSHVMVTVFNNSCDCDIYENYYIGKLNPQMNKYYYKGIPTINLPEITSEIYYTVGDNYSNDVDEVIQNKGLIMLPDSKTRFDIDRPKVKRRKKQAPAVEVVKVIEYVEVERKYPEDFYELEDPEIVDKERGDMFVGRVFGALRIRSVFENEKGSALNTISVCSCGKVKHYTLSSLLNGTKTSCGAKRCPALPM